MRTIPVPAGLGGDSWIQVVRVRYHPGDSYDLHDHAFAEIFWIESGIAVQRVNGCEQRLPAGTVVVMRPHDRHEFLPGAGFVMVNVTIRTELVTAVGEHLFGSVRIWPWGQDPMPWTARLAPATLERLQATSEDLAVDQSRLAAEGFLLDVLRVLQQAGPQVGVPAWLGAALDQLRGSEALRAGPAAFAWLCGHTPAHINRTVRAAFGITATALVNRIRLEEAARRLRLSDDGIAEIALACGFASLAHFYRAFGVRYQATPRHFRLSHQAAGMRVPETWRSAPVPITRPQRRIS